MFYLHPALFPSMSLRLFAALLRMLMKQLFRRSAGAALWLAWGVSCSRLCRPASWSPVLIRRHAYAVGKRG